jgi:hypothetical protein
MELTHKPAVKHVIILVFYLVDHVQVTIQKTKDQNG